MNAKFAALAGFIVALNHTTHVAQPVDPEGDRFFGLESGTNGSGATMRRKLVADGFKWERHDGRPATGLQLSPTGRTDWRNPWDGPAPLDEDTLS